MAEQTNGAVKMRTPELASPLQQALGLSTDRVVNMTRNRLPWAAERNPWKNFDRPAITGHFGTQWFLSIAGAYYRLKDRFQ